MKTTMDDSRLTNVSELREFLEGTQGLSIKVEEMEEAYKFIDEIVNRFEYYRLSRKDKHVVLVYLKKVTRYKKTQLLRLVKRAVRGELKRKKYIRKLPHRKYTTTDIKLLEKTDLYHNRLNGLATIEIMRRESELYGHKQYQRISSVSRSHLYNLRDHPVYKNAWVNGTKSRVIGIGKTEEPETNGKPGSVRVDTVHQRDVYHINMVDEVTQWEVVVCVPEINERCLLPALTTLLNTFPFKIFNFHSDRGSEFINKVVAKLLNTLLIEQTKSRSRHSNDNALIESKNGSVLRKNMGYQHIKQGAADIVNEFFINYLTPYLNFHRPCLYVTKTIVNAKGKTRDIYGEAMVPLDKLKEIQAKLDTNFLKPGITIKQLEDTMMQHSDNEFAKILRAEERKLFEQIERMPKIS